MHTKNETRQVADQLFNLASLSAPLWTDNRTLAVLDDRTGVPQVSMLDLDSGTLQVRTRFPERVLSLAGKSGSDYLIFGMDVGGNERQQLWRLDLAGGDAVRLTTSDGSMHENPVFATDKGTFVYRSNERDPAKFDIYGSSVSTFDPAIWMQADGMPHPLDASSELRKVLVSRLNTNLDASLLLVHPESGDVQDLLPHEGEAWIGSAFFDPGNAFVWLVSNVDVEFQRVLHIDLESLERREFYATDWDVEQLALSPDGSLVAVGINADGMSQVKLLDATSAEERVSFDLEPGVVDRIVWSPDSSAVAFGISTPTRPGRIVVGATDGSMRTFDAEPTADVPTLPAPEVIRYRTFDGREIPAFWFKPEVDGPFPVVVEVHGGPEGQRKANFLAHYQLWLSRGVAILATNVRGSTGYGKSYSHLDDVELRMDSVKDLAEAVTWLKANPDVDTDNIAVMGQSYGGFMTLAAITFFPDLWKAAVDVVGICNWISFLERTGPWRVKHRSYEYGTLEDNYDFLKSVSPLTHVESINTPLCVIHGRNDPRVPLFEAEQIVAALRARELPVELHVFDDEGHGLSKRKNRIEGYSAAVDFVLAQFG